MSWFDKTTQKLYDKSTSGWFGQQMNDIFGDEYHKHLFNMTVGGGLPTLGYGQDYRDAENEGESGWGRVGGNALRSAGILASIFGGAAAAGGGSAAGGTGGAAAGGGGTAASGGGGAVGTLYSGGYGSGAGATGASGGGLLGSGAGSGSGGAVGTLYSGGYGSGGGAASGAGGASSAFDWQGLLKDSSGAVGGMGGGQQQQQPPAPVAQIPPQSGFTVQRPNSQYFGYFKPQNGLLR